MDVTAALRSMDRVHPAIYATRFDLLAPVTLANLKAAWEAAPFARYLINTVMLVTLILAAQFVVCTLAAFVVAAVPALRGWCWAWLPFRSAATRSAARHTAGPGMLVTGDAIHCQA